MNNTPKPIHKLSVKRLGIALIATAGGMSIVSAATGPSPDPLHLTDIATVTIVDGATDLGASGFVDGTVRHLESIHGHTSSQLASQVTEAVEEIGCNKVGTLTGHPEPKTPNDTSMTTIIATQFDCGAYYAEIGWTTNEPGVDVVIGEASPALVRR